MANNEHVTLLKQGVEAWNAWRKKNLDLSPDLTKADLSEANLSGANLERARLVEATLTGANLIGACLHKADMFKANVSGAKLCGANLRGAYLRKANLAAADLNNANLIYANLVGANLEHSDLTGCKVYGISSWGLELKTTTQNDLLVADPEEEGEGELGIKVDNIEVAQFVYLMLHNEKIRDVIDTITSKAVLILGRFTKDRKAVLDAIRDELRKQDYLPILFDFDKPASRDITETVSLLARMSRFVLADITDAKSIPHELSLIVPDLPSVPVQPLLRKGGDEYSMFEHFRRYPWVLPIHRYDTPEQLIAELVERVIHPAEVKVQELRRRS